MRGELESERGKGERRIPSRTGKVERYQEVKVSGAETANLQYKTFELLFTLLISLANQKGLVLNSWTAASLQQSLYRQGYIWERHDLVAGQTPFTTTNKYPQRY